MKRKPRQQDRKRTKRDEPEVVWKPRTELGRLVKAEQIDSLDTIIKKGLVIKEPEIVDFFLSEAEERILNIGKAKRPFRWVQRMTDSGRRNKYFVVAAVGNKNGYVGLGIGRAKQYGGAISSALRQAKLNIIKIKRGCGSWECGCGEGHSIPVSVSGKVGSVSITLKPAPKGTGIVASHISKDILELAGVKDVWSLTKGHTKTRSNMASATFNALANIGKVKLKDVKKAEKKIEKKVEEKAEKKIEKKGEE